MKYTKEEKCLLWLDSFINLEYKHKSYLYKAIIQSNEIKAEIERQKPYIVENMGEGEYNTIHNSTNQVYFDFVLDNLETLRKNECAFGENELHFEPYFMHIAHTAHIN